MILLLAHAIMLRPQGHIVSNARVRSDEVDRSANVIFFGLPEFSLIDSKKLIDEITGSALGVKDLKPIKLLMRIRGLMT